MYTLTTTVDNAKLTDVIFALSALGANRMPATANAVRTATEAVQQRWIDNSMRAFKKPTGGYILGIDDGLIYPHENDVYKGAVFNNVPYASAIEHGRQPYDMKRALYTSSKVKISKKGKRYLIIPFRHGVPRAGGKPSATLQTMPQNIYQRAKKLPFTSRIGSSIKDGVTRNIYANPAGSTGRLQGVGDQGRRSQIAVRNPKDLTKFIRRANPYTWKTSPYENMIRVPRDTTGHGYYMTFRIMHQDSKGWIHPGTPPMKLAEKTAREMDVVVQAIITDGFKTDLNLLGLEV